MGADFPAEETFQMATAAALKSIDSLSGVDARMEALDKLER